MKKLLLVAALFIAATTGVKAQNVIFHGNVINGFWYQNNENNEWTTWLVGMYTFTDQKKTWTYEVSKEYDGNGYVTLSSPNIEVTNAALYGSQGAIYKDGYFYTFFGRESDNADDPGNIGGEYGYEQMEVVMRKWKVSDWSLVETKTYSPNRGLNFTDLTYDPNDDVVYCVYSDISGSGDDAFSDYYLGTLDLETMTVTRISQRAMSVEFRALAANPNGKLYGIAYGGRSIGDISFPGTLYSIDKKTGEYTKIGDIGHGIPRTKMQSAVCDWRTGKMYHAGNMYNSDVEKSTREKSTKDTGLYEIDINTGQATLISKFPYKETVVGLWIEGDYERKNRDLKISIETPMQTYVSEPASVVATVKNSGVMDANDYKVILYTNGRKVQSLNGTTLEPGASTSYTFSYTPTVGDGTAVVFQAEVEFLADQNPDNNKTDAMSVVLLQSTYPTVNLVGEVDGNTMYLAWEAPVSKTVKEDFERYAPFVVSGIGDWTTLQLGEKQATVTMRDWQGSYEYPNAGRNFAYQVFNPSVAGIDPNSYAVDTCTFYCQSGKQMLISAVGAKKANNEQGYEYVDSNDWLISPELSGNAQTISFYAKGWTSQVKDMYGSYHHYTEFFNVLYSLTDKNPNSFTQIGGTRIAQMWFSDGAFEFDLPAGTKYFAIQCISNGEGTAPEVDDETAYDYLNQENEGFIFFLDDITYTPAPCHLVGYNVYKNGQKLNSTPLPTTTTDFMDTDAQGVETNTYAVSAVYEEGESALSNAVIVTGTPINGVTLARGSRTDGVYTTSGQYIGQMVPQARGMYIIHRDGQSRKVLVR